jgi:hypothetical protein
MLSKYNKKPIGKKYIIDSQLLKKFPEGTNGHNVTKIAVNKHTLALL